MKKNTFDKQLTGMNIPIYLGEPVFTEGGEPGIDIYKLGKGKRSGGVYSLQKKSDKFVIKFYEELSSFENDTTALNHLYKLIDDNSDLKISAVKQIKAKFNTPQILHEAHENDLTSYLEHIEGSTLTTIWPQSPKEFKRTVIQSIKELENCFKQTFCRNGFEIKTELRIRKGLFSHKKTPTLRVWLTEPNGKSIRYCLHGSNFIITKQYQLVVIDPR